MFISIAFAGGPCSGKSLTHAELQKYPVTEKFRIIFVDELASVLLNFPNDYLRVHDSVVRQYYIYKSQRFIEDMCRREAERNTESNKDIILLCDRGIFDLYAYLPTEDVHKIVSNEEAKEFSKRYNHVLFFLPLKKSQFTPENNKIRTEKVYSEALAVSHRTLDAWEKHYHSKLTFIPPATVLEDKVQYTAKTINRLIGDTVFII